MKIGWLDRRGCIQTEERGLHMLQDQQIGNGALTFFHRLATGHSTQWYVFQAICLHSELQ